MTVRDRLASDLTERYETVRDVLMDAMNADRKAWAFCPDCGKKVQVDQPDHSARVKAAELWLQEAFGRAGTSVSSVVSVPSDEDLLGVSLEELTDDQLRVLAGRSDEKPEPVDWAARARVKPVPDPLFRKAGAA